MRHDWLCAGLLSLIAGTLLAQPAPEPEGYRLSDYDAPVPLTLAGATRVSAVEVRQLQRSGPVTVIDVIPEQRKPDTLPEDQLWLPVPHRGVAGALWLPDIGYGELSEVTLHYFLNHLRNVSGGDKRHPLVFYCRTDCWMSWNAARRALQHGYRKVYWFADGIQDWLFEDYPTEVLTPAAGQRQAF